MLQKVIHNEYLSTIQIKPNKPSSTPEFDKYKRAEAISWIKSIISMENKIKTMKDEIATIKDNIGISGVQYSDLPKSKNVTDDAVMNAVLMYETRCSQLNNLIEEYKKKITNADILLNCLKSSEYAYTVIKLHYFQRKTYTEIAFKLNYSEKQVRNILNAALIELYDILPYGPGYKTPLPKAI